jgi:hypothetical protein
MLERSGFHRVRAPMIQRPTSRFAQGSGGTPADAPVEGVRSYSDDRMGRGRLLEVDVFLPDGSTATAVAEVAWCDRLPKGYPAAYDVGLRIVKGWRGGTMEIERVLA